MSKSIGRIILFLLAAVAVLYPVWFWYHGASLSFQTIVFFDLFPLFGLIAFSTMWLHIIGGAFRSQLSKYIDFENFVFVSSLIVLVSLILHPLLLFVAIQTNGGNVFDYVQSGNEYLIWLAVTAWIIFITYDILKMLKNKGIFAKRWELIKFISTLAFFLTLIHSLGIGRDLQSGTLRSVWIFYGVSAALATFYSYVWRK